MKAKYIIKTLILMLAFSLFNLTAPAAYEHSYMARFLTKVPQDLRIIAISGSISPEYPVYKIDINSNGESVYYEMSAADRIDGTFTEIKKFKLRKNDLLMIYESIVENEFFEFKKEHINTSILDGTFAKLTVKANGKTHSVKTINQEVAGFDRIMLVINIVTPDGIKMIYNEII